MSEKPIRIIIEIDGKQVVATELPTAAPATEAARPLLREPPPELLQAARARGAQSAGPAAFVQAAGAAALRLAATTATAVTDDLDAGAAAAPAARGRHTAARAKKRRTKRAT